jgi:pyruvate dehydrogenase (quinone)
MVNPDFAKLAEVINIAACEAKEHKDVAKALRNGFNHDGPAIIDIFTDPNVLAMPPTIKLEQVIGMPNSMAKLMMNGKTAEVIETDK